MAEGDHQHHDHRDDEHRVPAGIARRARVLGDLVDIRHRRARAMDEVDDPGVPAGGQGRAAGKEPGAAVEEKDQEEDHDLEGQSLGVADPAEDAEGVDERAPVGGLDVALDRRVLRDVGVAHHVQRQHGGGDSRGAGDPQQGPVHTYLRVSRPKWPVSNDSVQERKPARCRRATSSSPTATTCSRA